MSFTAWLVSNNVSTSLARLATWYDQSGGGNHLINVQSNKWPSDTAKVLLEAVGSTYVVNIDSGANQGAGLTFTSPAVYPQGVYATINPTNDQYGYLLSGTRIPLSGIPATNGFCVAPPGLCKAGGWCGSYLSVNGDTKDLVPDLNTWSDIVVGANNTGDQHSFFTRVAWDPDG